MEIAYHATLAMVNPKMESVVAHQLTVETMEMEMLQIRQMLIKTVNAMTTTIHATNASRDTSLTKTKSVFLPKM